MTLSGRDLNITGLAATPRDRDAVLASLLDLPEGYTLTDIIEVEDDGTPLRLTLTNGDAGAAVTGKFPSGMAASLVSDRYAGIDTSDIVEATITGADSWPAVAATGMDALDALVQGELTINDAAVTLTGSASPDGRAQAEALMAALPAGFTSTTDISIYDDGMPFMMTMDYDGAAATAAGKYPADFTAAAPDGATLTQTGQATFIGDDTGAFATNAAAGVAALGFLEVGSLQVTVDNIILTGIARTPDVDAAIADALSAASGAEVEQTYTYLDDGAPADWSVSYDAATGGIVAGKLPNDLSVDLIAGAMGPSAIDGDPTVALGAADGPSNLTFLTLASEYLPETEKLSFATNGGQSTLDMVLSPGVDADLVAADLAARLPGDIAFSVTPLETLPETGAIRTNQATLNRERFQFGNWLPILTFAPVPTICTDQTTRALETNGVNFLSSSARLDAKSIRAINTLTAIAQRCVDEGGLSLEVGGHTDDTGSEISNQLLSENRANSVRNALIARGIPQTAMIATGFGQSRPLASNETEEGRATNRRTEIIWSE
ncbi:OmpA family protein [Octadecabacter sp.]|nr:OmpA family protein [Octadecabacter sp.]